MGILSSLMSTQQATDERRAEIYKSLIHWEGQIGGQLFGDVEKGRRREFFCLDKHTWVWHEEWTDESGPHTMTTRYDVRPNAIVKSQGDNKYETLNPAELQNFVTAVNLYCQQVLPELQRMSQIGQPSQPARAAK